VREVKKLRGPKARDAFAAEYSDDLIGGNRGPQFGQRRGRDRDIVKGT
jgi:hypothetical protein